MNTEQMTESALAAKALRAALKVAFPGIKFSVRSENYSMGDAVRVKWVDGPSRDAVEAISSGFTRGTFNGSTDSFEYDTARTGPTAMFVTCARDISPDLNARMVSELRGIFSSEPREDFDTLAWRILSKTDLRDGYIALRSVDGFPGFEVISATSEVSAAA